MNDTESKIFLIFIGFIAILYFLNKIADSPQQTSVSSVNTEKDIFAGTVGKSCQICYEEAFEDNAEIVTKCTVIGIEGNHIKICFRRNNTTYTKILHRDKVKEIMIVNN